MHCINVLGTTDIFHNGKICSKILAGVDQITKRKILEGVGVKSIKDEWFECILYGINY